MLFTSFCPRLYLELLKEQATRKVIRDTITPRLIRWGEIRCLVHHKADPLTIIILSNQGCLVHYYCSLQHCLLLCPLTKDWSVLGVWLKRLSPISCGGLFRVALNSRIVAYESADLISRALIWK